MFGDEKDPLAGLAPEPAKAATPAPASVAAAPKPAEATAAAKPKRVRKPAAKKPAKVKTPAKRKAKASKPKPRKAVKVAKAKRGRPAKVKAKKSAKGKSKRAARGTVKPPTARSGDGKPGRPRGSAVDSWKVRTTGKNLPRANTVRFTVCGAFTRPRVVSSAVASLSKGFKPPELDRGWIKHNAAKYFRVVIVSLIRAGALKRVK